MPPFSLPFLPLSVVSPFHLHSSVTAAMPTSSPYPSIDVPNLDIWAFLFERKDKPYPDDKGRPKVIFIS